MPKMVFVTGGAGYIGSHTVKELLKNNFQVVVYDNLSAGHRWAVLKPAQLVVGDLLDARKLRETLKNCQPDVIMHFAAFIEAGESMKQPGDFFRNNNWGTLNLIEAAKDLGIRKIIYSSSAAVYGEPKEIPITEESECKPNNAYGLTKYIDEEMLRYFDLAYGLKSIALRYFNAAGADPEGQLGPAHKLKTHLITRALMAANDELPYLEIFGTDYETKDGTCIRDYIHVTDLAKAHLLALYYLEKGNKSDVFNLGSEEGYSILEVIEATKRITGIDFEVRLAPRRPGDPARLVASSKKARAILGWRPQYNLDEIIQTAWAWQQKISKK